MTEKQDRKRAAGSRQLAAEPDSRQRRTAAGRRAAGSRRRPAGDRPDERGPTTTPTCARTGRARATPVGEMSAEELADADGAPPEPVAEVKAGIVSDELKAVIEALVYASPDPLTPKTLFKVLETEPREDVQVSLDALRRDYARGPRRPAAGRGRRRLPDRHAARALRVGAPAVPRAQVAEAVGRRARDAGRHRLQAADHGAGDHGDPRREHGGRRRRRCSSAGWSRSPAASRWSAGRSSTRRPGSS